MGKWKGKAPLSQDGDWSHGAVLRLKFNSHEKGKAKVKDSDATTIGQAYDLALKMTQDALDRVVLLQKTGVSFEVSPDNPFGTIDFKELVADIFGSSLQLDVVRSTLTETLRGLKDNSKENRVYLFTGASKPAQVDANGYVANYPQNLRSKKSRPAGPAFITSDTEGPKVGETHIRRKGHIHLNLESVQQNSLEAVAATIVHEATHLFAGTGDFAYQHQDKYKTLSNDERVNNADSYSHFCRNLHNYLVG